MNSVFILLNSLNDWKPYCETDSLMTVTGSGRPSWSST